MCGPQKLPLGSTQDPDAGLRARLDRKPMIGKALAQNGDAGRIGTGAAKNLTHNGQIDPLPFCRLMQFSGKGGDGALTLGQTGKELVGKRALPLGPQRRQHGPVMRPRHYGMTESQFKNAGDLLMPGMIEAAG